MSGVWCGSGRPCLSHRFSFRKPASTSYRGGLSFALRDSVDAVESTKHDPRERRIGGRAALFTTLAKAGADLNARDNFGYTPLHHIGHYNSSDTLECLMRLGADVNAKATNGETPLHHHLDRWNCSIDAPCPKTVGALINSGAEVNARDILGRTPLDINDVDRQTAPKDVAENITEILRAAGGKRGKDLP